MSSFASCRNLFMFKNAFFNYWTTFFFVNQSQSLVNKFVQLNRFNNKNEHVNRCSPTQFLSQLTDKQFFYSQFFYDCSFYENKKHNLARVVRFIDKIFSWTFKLFTFFKNNTSLIFFISKFCQALCFFLRQLLNFIFNPL